MDDVVGFYHSFNAIPFHFTMNISIDLTINERIVDGSVNGKWQMGLALGIGVR